ncbi:MAG: serine hydrolase [Eubacteriales bacterium]
MKCINKFRRVVCLVIAIPFVLSGCSSTQILIPYELNSDNSGFNILTTTGTKGESFASDLCIVTQDVFENTDVDMEQATAAGLFDVNNSEVLYAKNIHTSLYPASLTKVLTAIIALKYANVDDVITATSNVEITESGAQLCGLKAGDTLTLNQALHALLIYSANDAAVAIAEHIAGSVENFAIMMNEEAVSIGATNSNFVNPHGLTDENHYTTAYDLYLIFNEALNYSLFQEIISMTEYSTIYHNSAGVDKELSISNTNQFLTGAQTAPEQVTVIGGKTGSTAAAKSCLILLSKDASGNSYISVILASDERAILYAEMIDLLEEIYN